MEPVEKVEGMWNEGGIYCEIFEGEKCSMTCGSRRNEVDESSCVACGDGGGGGHVERKVEFTEIRRVKTKVGRRVDVVRWSMRVVGEGGSVLRWKEGWVWAGRWAAVGDGGRWRLAHSLAHSLFALRRSLLTPHYSAPVNLSQP